MFRVGDEPVHMQYVEISGLRIPEPSAAYGLLWELISGANINTATDGHLRLSSKVALEHLSRHFGSPQRTGPTGHAWSVWICSRGLCQFY
jgi:origin recognition complex subunit 1